MMCRLYIVLLLLSFPVAALADTPQPGKFFKQDYVKGTLENKREGVLSQSESGKKGFGQKTGVGSIEPDEQTVATSESFRTPTYNEHTLTDGDTRSLPIKSVSYIINGRDQKEALTAFKFFNEFTREYELKPRRLLILGEPSITTQDIPFDWARLIDRGGTWSVTRFPIEEYGIQKTPAWIVHTEDGDILLEGFEDLSPFLNLKGELKVSKVLKEPDAFPPRAEAPEETSEEDESLESAKEETPQEKEDES